MPAKFIGAHMPTAGGLHKAIRRGAEIGCTAVQVFTSSPQTWHAKPITEELVENLALALEETGIERSKTVSHDSYLINLCAPVEEKRAQSMNGLKSELVRCSQLGIPYVVSHMGAHMGQGEEAGLALVAEAALQIMDDTPDDVSILMETTAGQGSSLNYRFEHLAKILELTHAPDRLCICLDTCHIFAAGYDIRTKETYESTFAEFDRLIGCDRIKVVHCNDSKKAWGSRVDRHEHLGDGEIGPVAFQCLVKDSRFENTPIVVETPDADEMHAENVRRLWDWAQA